MKQMNILTAIATSLLFASCNDTIEMRYPPKYELPDLPVVEGIHKYKAPLYWSVYEYCYELEKAGVPSSEMDITSQEWDNIINWVSEELQPYGYDMICTDGFIPMLANDASGYMTHYGSVSLEELVAKCHSKGIKLGVYDNPLWIHGSSNTQIPGTNYTFGSLTYNGSQSVNNPNAEDTWFTWAVAENPGTKEYIDGFFKHYYDLGVEFIRMDFLSWYEDGKDRGMGTVGRGYGHESYARALAYIAESANKYGIFTSLVMPHMFNDAEVESTYGNMVRIVADTADGGWWHCSRAEQGKSYPSWPNCMNMFDGFTYWSHITGPDKVIPDGDFIRLNKFSSEAECQTVISLQLMAGGPLAAADQYNTIGDRTKYYTNTEILELNKDRFVGKPLSDKLGDPENQVWYGQLSNGDYVIGFFNRSDDNKSYSYNLTELGIEGAYNVRDLWAHTDEGVATTLNVSLSPHGCKILRLSE
ncbi:MAG: glucan 1,6-alpha-isomaltosidase [Muribaculaceae bacterium]|nr:glucan 1,6-alpha-isomaltosidase [Muribaculaceae bacterium]